MIVRCNCLTEVRVRLTRLFLPPMLFAGIVKYIQQNPLISIFEKRAFGIKCWFLLGRHEEADWTIVSTIVEAEVAPS